MNTLVIDARSRRTRVVHERWRRWREAPPPWLPVAAAVTTPLQRRLLHRRLARRAPPPEGVQVVSVGNLAVGGTGKTPVTIVLAAALRRRGLPVAVVTRGHGAADATVRRVDPADVAAADEARLMAARLPDVPVIQGRDRRTALARAATLVPGGVVLVEDGHQAVVGRHRDLLILDRWEVVAGRLLPCTGWTLPWGPYREPAGGAVRADAWLLPLEGGARLPDAEAPVHVFGFHRHSRLPAGALPDAPAPYGLVTGVARPAAVQAACAAAAGRPPVVAVWHDDHVRYGARDLARLADLARRHDLAAWVTTAKDAVKLQDRWPGPVPLVELDLVITWVGDRDPASWLARRISGEEPA